MDRKEEKAYIRGHAMACAGLLKDAVRALRGNGLEEFEPLARVGALEAERTHAIQAIRSLFEELGVKSEFPDNLHLADIIEKHLGRALRTTE